MGMEPIHLPHRCHVFLSQVQCERLHLLPCNPIVMTKKPLSLLSCVNGPLVQTLDKKIVLRLFFKLSLQIYIINEAETKTLENYTCQNDDFPYMTSIGNNLRIFNAEMYLEGLNLDEFYIN